MDDSLKERLCSTFDGLSIEMPDEDRMTIDAGKEAVLSVLGFLKLTGYDHLQLISCVDWIEENEFELVYVLSAYMREKGYTERERAGILVKTRIPRDRARTVSSITIFGNAEPYERELHELFGIEFDGHPRLTPLFLEREYEIPPFRKDFDTRKYVEEVFGGIPPVEEESQKA